MHRRIYPIVGLVLLVLSLAVGCGRSEVPTTASALDPQDAEAYVDRGNARYDQGDLDLGHCRLHQAIALDPQYARGLQQPWERLPKKGDLDQAIADYDQAILLDPELTIPTTTAVIAYVPKAT